MLAPFSPGPSATLVAGTTSNSVALPGTFAGMQQRTVRVANAGPDAAYIHFGVNTPTALVTTAGGSATLSPDGGMFVPAGVIETFSPVLSATHMAAITASGTATLRITTGHGD